MSPMNGPKRPESGRRRYGQDAPGAGVHEISCERVDPLWPDSAYREWRGGCGRAEFDPSRRSQARELMRSFAEEPRGPPTPCARWFRSDLSKAGVLSPRVRCVNRLRRLAATARRMLLRFPPNDRIDRRHDVA